VRYDGRTAPVRLPPQRLGAQTAEVLAELGIDTDAQCALAERGAIGLG
jgi:crotonobetainyl-CoA:carnitine CoA-transferase CaiB-like acyl-CoA transferase